MAEGVNAPGLRVRGVRGRTCIDVNARALRRKVRSYGPELARAAMAF